MVSGFHQNALFFFFFVALVFEVRNLLAR
jgi:hypothetical protein